MINLSTLNNSSHVNHLAIGCSKQSAGGKRMYTWGSIPVSKWILPHTIVWYIPYTYIYYWNFYQLLHIVGDIPWHMHCFLPSVDQTWLAGKSTIELQFDEFPTNTIQLQYAGFPSQPFWLLEGKSHGIPMKLHEIPWNDGKIPMSKHLQTGFRLSIKSLVLMVTSTCVYS